MFAESVVPQGEFSPAPPAKGNFPQAPTLKQAHIASSPPVGEFPPAPPLEETSSAPPPLAGDFPAASPLDVGPERDYQTRETSTPRLEIREYANSTQAAGLVDQGLRRQSNQDSIYLSDWKEGKQPSPWQLLIVADGVGGNLGGDLASSLVCSLVSTYLEEKLSNLPATAPRRNFLSLRNKKNPASGILKEAVLYANQEIVRIKEQAWQSVLQRYEDKYQGRDREYYLNLLKSENRMDRNDDKGVIIAWAEQNYGSDDADVLKAAMDSTIVAALHNSATKQLIIAHAGDSRAYIADKDNFRQVTRDHTELEEALSEGLLSGLSDEEKANHFLNHIISRSIGTKDLEVDIYETQLEEDKRLLLCSDGLSGPVDANTIRELMMNDKIKNAPTELIAAANAAGGPDNIAAVLLGAKKF
ncbi:MAG: protein phosphatase 2C domain-containing protein [Candidatus Woesebacteria bacterium]|jgi:serine/threonine protein phosphatase PrpC